jgi:transcriptional regulator with XRE-family HTH domain
MQNKRTKLIAARASKHWTLSQASDKIGCAPNTLSRWELGTLDPSPYYRQRLCLIYERSAEQLGLEEPTARPLHFPIDVAAQAYADANPTARLLSQISLPDVAPVEVQRSVENIIEEYINNNHEQKLLKGYQEALHIVAMNPIISHLHENLSRSMASALNQYAAAITACNYLRNSSYEDIHLVSTLITTYIPALRIIAGSVPRHQKITLELLAKALQMKAIVASMLEGMEQGILYGEEALKCARESGNHTLLAILLRSQFADYEFGLVEYPDRRRKAHHVIEEISTLLQQKHSPPISPLIQSWLYTGLAKYQALCHQKNETAYSINMAEEKFFASSEADRASRNINYSQSYMLRHKAITYAYQGRQDKCCKIFGEQLIDVHNACAPKLPMTPRNRLGILSEMTFATLYVPHTLKDKELSIALWKTHLEETKNLRDETYYAEARMAYQVMRGIWSDDEEVLALRDLLVKW